MKKITYSSLIILIILLSVEIYLRIYYGFCDAVLMKKDTDFEYIAKYNQKRERFGNHIIYNEYGMRNNSIDSTSLKILIFGDSVINGGSLTDHDSLATTILSKNLSHYLDTNVQVLNISAGSWGVDNCFAYLKKYGDFNTPLIILLFSSHDACDNMTFENIVGVNKSYPNKQYQLAVIELLDRYLFPDFNKTKTFSEKNLINKKSKKFSEGFNKFINYTNKQDIKLICYLHAEQIELKYGKYNKNGQKILNLMEKENVIVIQELDKNFQSLDYRDNIHFSEKGQKKMANILLDNILQVLKKN